MQTYATREEAERDTLTMGGWHNVRVVQEPEPDITGEQRWYILANAIAGMWMPVGTYCFEVDGHACRWV